MNNTRFATAIHILTLLDHNPEVWLTSEWIAGSININAVVVRKELGVLQEAGLVISRKGKEGGSMLAKQSIDITLDAIYDAVRNAEVLGRKNQHTNPLCPVGKQINTRLDGLFTETDTLLKQFLGTKTLHDFSRQFE
ncbi:RrF2 family transcriptional regulator [Sphingobacterium deserti]|uniref:Transcriptional regulator, badm/rrf2 family n=1 Tax=Sphingobacterium deserti TaxID=1229276 RepID=A0A0B8T0E3_9SPHI|nr:Rrf2 family transcriptional regulator [Sphingobacterium deserti]KGE13731.1 transcriptional regulator, badm/rrf2 family [Sphingobacterium deserti]